MGVDRAPGLVECARALAAGEVTSRALVTAALARIEATQGTVNAFRRVRAEAALVEADAADRELAEGGRRPLLGVPTLPLRLVHADGVSEGQRQRHPKRLDVGGIAVVAVLHVLNREVILRFQVNE